jgi:hypothetical protein
LAVDFSTSPKLFAILDGHRPRAATPGKRTITLGHESYFDDDWLVPAALELSSPTTADAVSATEVAVFAYVAGSKLEASVTGATDLAEAVQAVVERRWSALALPLARTMLSNPSHGSALAACLPALTRSPELIEAMIHLLQDGVTLHLRHVLDLRELSIASLDQARRLLPIATGQFDTDLRIYVLGGLSRGLGWTAWVKLQAILLEFPELAGDDDTEEPSDPTSTIIDLPLELRRGAWRAIVDDLHVRAVAQLINDLDGALAYASPDVRGVYVGRMRTALGSDLDLRRATIEALLDGPRGRQEDLSLYAAIALTLPADAEFIEELTRHPRREAGYRASMLQTAVFGNEEDDASWPRPTITGIAEGLFQLRLAASAHEPAGTWLGDRLLEQMIEHTSASVEEKFASGYHDHAESDEEEGLLRIFFSDLAHQFSQLDQALLATARATRSKRRTRVSIAYRSVSKSEEGKAGVSRTGNDADAPDRFSADLCLIVDPYLDGKALGKRATLIQAKRLYRRDTAMPERGFLSSYRLKPQQMKHLLDQTGSSFYLFQGPGSAGRAVPILPTQLVADLAYHQPASAGQIDHEMVGVASQPFSKWLTYEVLALRTGDPLEQLVAKAEGGEGRRPRPLARFATVEIEIRVSDPLKEID